MPVVVVGLSHHSSPVTVRERFAFAEARIPAALQTMRELGIAEEAVILSTCNRVEVYASTALDTPAAFAELQQWLLRIHDYRDPITDELYRLDEPQSIEHLFKVASGLDSLVLGETEILGQLKKAYDVALQHRFTGSRLNKIFQRAFNVAKQIRTDTNIQRGSVSVGSVAAELAEKIFGSLDERTVMVIGAGDTSEKTARALASRGAKKIMVSNRSYERAVALALDLNGTAVKFDDWAHHFAQIDIIISSTSAPGYVIEAGKLQSLIKPRLGEPLLLVDIAVPRDIDPEVNAMEGVYLYNIDDLQAIAADYLKQRQAEIAQCEAIIREKAAALAGDGRRGTQPKPRPAFDHQ